MHNITPATVHFNKRVAPANLITKQAKHYYTAHQKSRRQVEWPTLNVKKKNKIKYAHYNILYKKKNQP